MALFTLYVAWPFLRSDRFVTGVDTYLYSGPNLDLTLRGLRSGRIITWNDYIFGGIPHAANPQTAVFYPLKWPFAWLGTARAWELILALHLFLFAFGMLVLVRRLRLGPPAGLAAGVIAVGSGMTMARVLYFEQMQVVALAPWLLAALDAALAPQRRARPALVGLATVGSLVLLAGHPQTVYIVAALAAAFTLGQVVSQRSWRRLVLVAGAGMLAVGVATVQLWPTLELTLRSAHLAGRSVGTLTTFSTPGRALAVSFVGDPLSHDLPATVGNNESVSSIGVAGLLLAVLGFVAWARDPSRRWLATCLAVATTVAAVLALGPRSPVFGTALRIAPGFDQARVPARWTLVSVLGLALLAAAGVDALRRGAVGRLEVGTVAGAAAVGGLSFVVFPFRHPPAASLACWALAAAAVVFAAVVVTPDGARRLRATGRAGLVAAAVVAVVGMELGWPQRYSAARGLARPEPFTELDSPLGRRTVEAGGRLLSIAGDDFSRADYLVATLRPNADTFVGARSLDGYDGGVQVTERWADTMALLAPGPFDAELMARAQLSLPVKPQPLARLGVRWALVDRDWQPPGTPILGGWGEPVATEGRLALYENPDWVGEAVLHDRWSIACGDEVMAAVAAEPGGAAVVEDCDAGAEPSPLAGPASATAVEVRRPRPGRIEASVQVPGTEPQLVVFDTQVDPGWRLSVDGDRAEIVTVDGFSIGAVVDPGAHELQLRHGLVHGRVAATVSLLALASLAALAVSASRSRGSRASMTSVAVSSAGGDAPPQDHFDLTPSPNRE
ncbi:MAG: hypothetical protein OEY23_07785 [Acidimicrobiia bacterium]|nr:hypothetical protein [Acidimicrobiia bacterium]